MLRHWYAHWWSILGPVYVYVYAYAYAYEYMYVYVYEYSALPNKHTPQNNSNEIPTLWFW